MQCSGTRESFTSKPALTAGAPECVAHQSSKWVGTTIQGSNPKVHEPEVTSANWLVNDKWDASETLLHPWKPNSPFKMPLKVFSFSHAYVPLTIHYFSQRADSIPKLHTLVWKIHRTLKYAQSRKTMELTVAAHHRRNVRLNTSQELSGEGKKNIRRIHRCTHWVCI